MLLEYGVSFLSLSLILLIFIGFISAIAALYGRYRELPHCLTGPQICQKEASGCEILFRTSQASLLGLPNALLGIIFYLLLSIGLWQNWPKSLLLSGGFLAFVMSLYLAVYLLRNRLECRICWAGHIANALLLVILLLRFSI